MEYPLLERSGDSGKDPLEIMDQSVSEFADEYGGELNDALFDYSAGMAELADPEYAGELEELTDYAGETAGAEGPGFGLVVGILALGAAAALSLRKRRN